MIPAERFTAWVVIQGADHRQFWRMFTRRGWRHCFVILPVYFPEKRLTAHRWSQVVEARTNAMNCEVHFVAPEAMAQHALENGATCVIKIRVDRRGIPAYVPRGFLTCVTVTKAIINCGHWYTQTPWQLARAMIRSGGELIEKREDDE